jgi:hypothetical protein
MRRHPLTSVLATGSMVLLGACGASTTTTRAASTKGTTTTVTARAASASPQATVDGVVVSYLGPIPHSEYDPNTGVSLSVPLGAEQHGIPWQTAAANCFTREGICNRWEGAVRISLAVGYYPNSGQMKADGSIDPAMNHVLVYVLAQKMGPCSPVGGRPSAATTAEPKTYPSCTALSFIDAHDGRGLAAMSGPALTDPSAD